MLTMQCRPRARACRRPGRPAAGFSAIEAMVVVALVAILLAVAVPSMVALLQGNRAAGELNSLVGDLQYARTEAIRRGEPVSVCPSADGGACLEAGTWHSGWIVFADTDRSGTRDGGEPLLRRRPGWASGDTLQAEPDLPAVTYGRDGFALNLPAGSVTLPLRVAQAEGAALRCLTLNRVGRQSVQRGGLQGCT